MGGDATPQSPPRGTSGVREEHLKIWMATAQKSEKEKEEAEKEAATTMERAGMTESGR